MTTETPTSEADGKAAFSVALDGMRVLTASASLERLAGRPPGALVDRPVSELWAPSERDAIAARFDEVVVYGHDDVGALALVKPDGSLVLVELDARYAHRGGERLEIVVVPLDGVPDGHVARVPIDSDRPVDPPDDDPPDAGPPDDDPPDAEPPDHDPSDNDPSDNDPPDDEPPDLEPTEIEATTVDGDEIMPGDVESPDDDPPTVEPTDADPPPAPHTDGADRSGARAALIVLDAAGLGALWVDPGGTVSGATSLAGRILGRPAAELAGPHVDRHFIFEETMAGVLDDARSERRRTTLGAGARGGSVHAALEWVPVGDAGAGILLVREMRPDDGITDRLKRRQQLADNAAHDARNALSAMVYGFATLRERLADEPSMLSIVDELDQERAKVCEIIDNHLDSFQGGTGVAEPIDLAAMLRDVAARFLSKARAGAVELHTDLAPDVIVRTDSGRLQRMFDNLVENALRAMPDGGSLDIISTADDRDRPGVRVEVRDDGVGMEESVRSRIFERGYSTADGRRGLGLSIVRDFILASDGEIECVSAPGLGARFIIWLPRETA